jgi:methylthioribose-1-phosphate isomerase
VKAISSLGLVYDHRGLRVLDQRHLPGEEVWREASDPTQMAHHIATLTVRGAPMIGVCAALSLACAWGEGIRGPALRALAMTLRAARPTAVNLAAAVDRLLPIIDADGPVGTEAESIFHEDVALCEHMAEFGAPLIGVGERVLTICNTGGLATVGIGTAAGVLRRAHELGRGLHVIALETRPLLQGARLTAWECLRLGVPVRLATDGMAGTLMASGQVDRVMVGADRVAANGDFANKIGTLSVAVLAKHYRLPFHVVAPWTTVDLACARGDDIPIEERPADEVRGALGRRWAPADVPVINPAFDVTPADLVTSLVTDRGVFDRDALMAGELAASADRAGER